MSEGTYRYSQTAEGNAVVTKDERPLSEQDLEALERTVRFAVESGDRGVFWTQYDLTFSDPAVVLALIHRAQACNRIKDMAWKACAGPKRTDKGWRLVVETIWKEAQQAAHAGDQSCPVCGETTWAEEIPASIDGTPSTRFVIEGTRHCPNEQDEAHFRYWTQPARPPQAPEKEPPA